MNRPLLPALAALALLAGCEADDSMPTYPRAGGGLLAPNSKAQQNAEQRTLEKPARELPTGRTDLPGQSAAPAHDSTILTLDVPPTATPTPTNPDFPISGFYGPSGWKAVGHTTGPVTTYPRDPYQGLVPHLPPDPGTVPMTGSTPLPGGDWAVDHSWGQGLTLNDFPHRDWPQSTATYQTINAKHDPLYFFNLQEHLPVKQNDGSTRGNIRSVTYEVPWFYINTAALPVLMVLEPPLAQRSTSSPTQDPNYNGHLPDGKTVPAPFPGVLKWELPANPQP